MLDNFHKNFREESMVIVKWYHGFLVAYPGWLLCLQLVFVVPVIQLLLHRWFSKLSGHLYLLEILATQWSQPSTIGCTSFLFLICCLLLVHSHIVPCIPTVMDRDALGLHLESINGVGGAHFISLCLWIHHLWLSTILFKQDVSIWDCLLDQVAIM